MSKLAWLMMIFSLVPACSKKGTAGGACKTTTDCTSGLFCVGGVCSAECKQPSDCASGETCINRACLSITGSTTGGGSGGSGSCSPACVGGQACNDGTCTTVQIVCDPSAGCSCTDNGQCTASADGPNCVGGKCGCIQSSDCGAGQVCAANGKCSAVGCDDSHACNGGCCDSTSTCQGGTAQTACGLSGACLDCTGSGAGIVCNTSGACGCLSGTESGGHDCDGNPNGPVCTTNGTCGCASASDCLVDGDTCSDAGICVVNGCDATHPCANSSGNYCCDTVSGTCLGNLTSCPDGGGGSNLACDPNNNQCPTIACGQAGADQWTVQCLTGFCCNGSGTSATCLSAADEVSAGPCGDSGGACHTCNTGSCSAGTCGCTKASVGADCGPGYYCNDSNKCAINGCDSSHICYEGCCVSGSCLAVGDSCKDGEYPYCEHCTASNCFANDDPGHARPSGSGSATDYGCGCTHTTTNAPCGEGTACNSDRYCTTACSSSVSIDQLCYGAGGTYDGSPYACENSDGNPADTTGTCAHCGKSANGNAVAMTIAGSYTQYAPAVGYGPEQCGCVNHNDCTAAASTAGGKACEFSVHRCTSACDGKSDSSYSICNGGCCSGGTCVTGTKNTECGSNGYACIACTEKTAQCGVDSKGHPIYNSCTPPCVNGGCGTCDPCTE